MTILYGSPNYFISLLKEVEGRKLKKHQLISLFFKNIVWISPVLTPLQKLILRMQETDSGNWNIFYSTFSFHSNLWANLIFFF